MDNLCHTLVGAAMGEAGLKRLTRFGNPILMVAANLPDVDAAAFLTDTPSVAIRRGWTHGIVAQAALPLIFTGLVVALDRLYRRRTGSGPPVRAGAVLLLSYAGVITHVLLDLLNNYGVRLLMPFSGRWFYGDSVFIVDPWLWATFGIGIWWARRRRTPRPAMLAIGVAAIYIAGMVVSARAARAIVLDAWVMTHGGPPSALMVGPVPLNPLRKAIIVDDGAAYRTGTFAWWPRSVRFDPRPVPKNADAPAAVAARQDGDIQAVLVWARFPYYGIEPTAHGTCVTLRDLRFGSHVGEVRVLVR